MSGAFFSTMSGWESQAPYYAGLNLDCSDVLFGTDMQGTRMYIPGGINYCSLSTTLGLQDQEEQEKNNVLAYSTLYNENLNQLNEQVEPYLPKTFDTAHNRITVVNVLLDHPQCTKFSKMVQKAGMLNYLYQSDYSSLFIPIDSVIPDNEFQAYMSLPRYTLRTLIQAHTLNYALDPSTLINRKHQILTTLTGFTPIIDGRNPNHIKIYENDYDMNNGVEYAPLIKRSTILQQIVTSTGTAYLINTVLKPKVLMS
jgi:hypothetical protein